MKLSIKQIGKQLLQATLMIHPPLAPYICLLHIDCLTGVDNYILCHHLGCYEGLDHCPIDYSYQTHKVEDYILCDWVYELVVDGELSAHVDVVWPLSGRGVPHFAATLVHNIHVYDSPYSGQQIGQSFHDED
nr:hypothetical protein Iba_scaffold3961.4CG0710 [Ipomoea batatas]